MVIYGVVGKVVPGVYCRLESPGGLTGRTKSAARGEYCGELGDQRSRGGVRLGRCAAPGTWRLKRPRLPHGAPAFHHFNPVRAVPPRSSTCSVYSPRPDDGGPGTSAGSGRLSRPGPGCAL